MSAQINELNKSALRMPRQNEELDSKQTFDQNVGHMSASPEALAQFRNVLNFQVISRYDSAIKKLLCHTSHCVVYKFNDGTQEWVKTEFQGALALYLRDFITPEQGRGSLNTFKQLQEMFCYGLILLNRNSPECFSLGLLPNRITKYFFPNGVDGHGVLTMDVELNDSLIIVKDLLGDIYGLWIFDDADCKTLSKAIEFCLNSEL